MPSTFSVGLLNTGSHKIYDVSFVLQGSRDFKGTYDIGVYMPQGGLMPGKAVTAGWPLPSFQTGCVRIMEMDVVLADVPNLRISGKDMDQYMTPPVNKHCAPSTHDEPHKIVGNP